MALNSLKGKKDFDRVFKKGLGFKENFLLLKFVHNSLTRSRLGIIVSKKISKKAITRNKIRRRIRAIVYPKLNLLKNNLDVVIMALPGIEEKTFAETEKAIDKLWSNKKFKQPGAN